MAEEERRPRTSPQDDEAAARRRQIIEEAKARWAAKKAAAEGAGAPRKPQAEERQAARTTATQAQGAQAAAAPAVEVFVASVNPGASPVAPPQNLTLRALGTINQAIEIEADPSEEQNLRKLITRLRQRLEPKAQEGTWRFIRNVRGRGYWLNKD